ncbi:outer membrane lipoprotein LolB [Usitatibacter palustris]|uniref:Outer-membrane lipoprotein LolB n=1 Tax=Usitatibacter palustris TaxID=2732487 RepID=A0A6M4H3I3_9PROT|nr:outer membrane lipoprotein LolB [Usitatibacter palustris]QJR13638.1 Outer-membrane lipoprotein LolB [Usitatibacter palustris]
MAGRISVRQGQSGEIARLRWTHRGTSDIWVVSSPVGNEVARIDSNTQGARLTRADAIPMEAESFAALTENLLGARLEPADMARWLHGEPASRDAAGWQVSIDESQPAGRVQLARRITATRGDVVVKLVVDDYRVLE